MDADYYALLLGAGRQLDLWDEERVARFDTGDTAMGTGRIPVQDVVWRVTSKGDRDAVDLADRHYSRRKVGSPQFMPPGQTLVLIAADAVWGWWRPHPRSGIRQMNGLDGWTCTIFRNEGAHLSSRLILEAESVLYHNHHCGPDGMLTYVWDARVRSINPGYCFKRAGWSKIGRSADNKKTLLRKPFELAGIER